LSITDLFSNEAAERYSRALFAVGKDSSNLEKIVSNTKTLLNYYNSDKEFQNFITNPTIELKTQLVAFEIIAKKMIFQSEFKNFLFVLTTNRRVFYLKRILTNFLLLNSKNMGEVNVLLTSSKELTDANLKEIKDELSKIIGSQIKFEFSVDEKLISGIKIQIGSLMIDTSLKSKLNNYEQIMLER